MRKCLYVICLIVFLPSLSIAQIDAEAIFVWDNDRGKSIQKRVGIGLTGDNGGEGYAVWQDSRWGDFDVYGQAFNSERMLVGPNFMVSEDEFNEYNQKNADIAGNLIHDYIAVWEDSLYRPDEKPAKIYAAFKGDKPWLVYEHEQSQKWPAVSSRANGWFAICWTSYRGYPEPSILCNIYDTDGGFVHQNEVVLHDSITGYVPESRVAFCDEGGMVAYEDYSRDGTEYSIYGQFFDRDGNIKEDRAKLSRISGDGKDERDPDIAVNEAGRMVVVWEDYYDDANGDIWAQVLQAQGDHFTFINTEFPIATGTQLQCNPRVALVDNGSFVVVWEEDRDGSYDVWYRVWISGELYPEESIAKLNTNRQEEPNIAARWGDLVDMVWTTWAYNNYPDVCLRHFKYNSGAQTGLDSLSGDIPLVAVNPDTGVGGRKCWYYDDENYDDTTTTDWNEDPIPEGAPQYVDLDYAIVDQLMELNTNGQYVIDCEDTLPFLQGDPLTDYDAIFLDLGYRTTLASAGMITQTERNELSAYVDSSGGSTTGGPLMVDGNDFGYMYDTTKLFSKYFGAEFKGDGAPYTTGNIDTLIGHEFAKDQILPYCYKELPDNYPDSIRPIAPDGKLILEGGNFSKWMAGYSVGSSMAWFEHGRTQFSTIYNSFTPSAITGTIHPHTYSEYYRRCLGHLGLSVQPEPIVDLSADTAGLNEGEVELSWTIVCDDDIDDPVNDGYKLKFSRTKMTSEAEYNTAEEYYQEWTTPGNVDDPASEVCYGLPPMDTLIFALKVKDEDGLYNALGAEPRAMVVGDSVSPHKIVIADNYVKDFSNKFELIEVDDDIPSDSLFVTWDGSNIYFGFTRRSFQSGADLLVYIDLTTGGADSTMPRNGASNRAYFDADAGIFHPEYCLVLENSTLCSLYQCTAIDRYDNWTGIAFSGEYSHDNIVNSYEYTEIRLPFSNISYVSSNSFKLVVTVQQEWFNTLTTVFPIYNQTGSSATISQYYYWGYLDDDMVPNQTFNIIGIEDNENLVDAGMFGRVLLVIPNPFASTVDLYLNTSMVTSAKNATLCIFDVTGRLVRDFDLTPILQKHTPKVIWDGKDSRGMLLPGGIYFCELKTDEESVMEKIIYIR